MIKRSIQDHDVNRAWTTFNSASEFISPTPKFPGAKTTVLAAGPPVFEDAIEEEAKVIGLTQSFAWNQGKQVTRIFELGSGGNFLVPGRGAGSASASQVMFAGPTLLGDFYPNVSEEEIQAMYRKPGYNKRYVNLMSELFDRPFGLFAMFLTPSNELILSFYLEACYISGSQSGVSAQGNIIVNNAAFQYQDMIPVDPGEIS